MKKYVIFSMVVLLSACLLYIIFRQVLIRDAAPSSLMINGSYGAGIEDTLKGRALRLQKERIDPILENILVHPADCRGLIDDEKAFQELKGLDARAETPDKFIDFWNQKFLVHLMNSQSLTPEFERQIQHKTEGHITYLYPNKGTVEALAGIWQRYPCSEAAAIALLKINKMLTSGYINSIQINGKVSMPYKPEIDKLGQYIIINYPDGWQAQIAILSKGIMSRERYSLESIDAWKNWIEFLEDHDVVNNKYYLYYAGKYYTDIVSVDYSILSGLYLGRCKELEFDAMMVNGNINPNGKIPQEAIDMYNAHVELMKRIKDKYPDQYREMTLLPGCYELIKKYAPDQYHGDPSLVKDK